MRVASSLTNRIFLASTVLAALSLGFAFYVVNARASAEAEAELRRGIADAATIADLRRQNLNETFATMTSLIADLPKLKAAVETKDPPTIQPLADDYRKTIAADVLVVTAPDGRVLAASGGDRETIDQIAEWARTKAAPATVVPYHHGFLQIASNPIFLGVGSPETLGRLLVGFFMDNALATRLKQLTASEVAFVAGGQVLASSLPPSTYGRLAAAAASTDIVNVVLDDQEYLALARPMHRVDAAEEGQSGFVPVTLVLRSRTERMRFLNTVRNGLVGALIVTVLAATILSYFVARTMTRPLAAVTDAMRDVAATGDLTRRVPVRSRAWDDEDARLLATAFNTLTESIARFQRQAAQKERLSSLGRLSTVIAHEVRNPLMIIRASLSTLRRADVTPADIREVVADIDGETTRLNRIVSEVLDFARPVRFDLAEANLNDICRASVDAAWTGAEKTRVELQLDPALPPIVTDSERLRSALVNILTNARHAVEAAAGQAATDAAPAVGPPDAAPVVVSTSRRGDRVAVTVRDNGVGISPEDMAHIFDPYYTTRRTGTGLGLPISKNIVEGLGGSISVTSRRGEGTDIRIDLPLLAPEAAA